MSKQPNEWPATGELVIGTIGRVNPFSAFVILDEYPGKEGMIHVSEIARKWIRDIRDFVKEGQRVVVIVLKVERESGHISLSLKRVSESAATERLKLYKRESKAEKMLAAAAKEMNISVDEAYNQVGFKLMEQFGEMFKGFQTAVDNQPLLLKKGIPEKWAIILKVVAEKQLEAKEQDIKGDLELKITAPDGVDQLKKILIQLQAGGVTVRYISAPKYLLSIRTRNAKSGEKKLRELSEIAIKAATKIGGEGKFSIV